MSTGLNLIRSTSHDSSAHLLYEDGNRLHRKGTEICGLTAVIRIRFMHRILLEMKYICSTHYMYTRMSQTGFRVMLLQTVYWLQRRSYMYHVRRLLRRDSEIGSRNWILWDPTIIPSEHAVSEFDTVYKLCISGRTYHSKSSTGRYPVLDKKWLYISGKSCGYV